MGCKFAFRDRKQIFAESVYNTDTHTIDFSTISLSPYSLSLAGRFNHGMWPLNISLKLLKVYTVKQFYNFKSHTHSFILGGIEAHSRYIYIYKLEV